MQKLQFTKVHWTWNDFILIDNLDWKLNKINLNEKLIIKMCDRHFGIWSDWILIIEKSKEMNSSLCAEWSLADFKYVMYNSDWSKSEMCGNWIRCYMLYLIKKWLIKWNKVNVETWRWILELEYTDWLIKVLMWVPILCSNTQFNNAKHWSSISSNWKEFNFNFISMWNPHCVIFLDKNEDLENFELEKYWKSIENNKDYFPQRTNTEFVQIIDSTHWKLRVWERGCWETLSCWTWVCASVVAGILNWYFEKWKDIEIQIKWWRLAINWSWNIEDSVIMKWPAEIVFEWEYFLN